MGRITTDQSHQIMAALATNTDWGSIDFVEAGLQDAIIRNQKGAGAAFTSWLKSGASVQAVEKSPLPAKKSVDKPAPLLSVVATTNLSAVKGKKTKSCFVGGIWDPNYRDGHIDHWLPANQPATGPCVVSTCAMSRDWTFTEAAQAVTGLDTTDVMVLGNELVKRGHTMPASQAEEMVEITERGGDTKMRIDFYGNFFFTETGDLKQPVSVGGVDRGERAWCAGVRRLGGDGRWDAGGRLLLRNVDASKL